MSEYAKKKINSKTKGCAKFCGSCYKESMPRLTKAQRRSKRNEARARKRAAQAAEAYQPRTLETLPPELLVHIQRFLTAHDARALHNTSRYTRANSSAPVALQFMLNELTDCDRPRTITIEQWRRLLAHIDRWVPTASIAELAHAFMPFVQNMRTTCVGDRLRYLWIRFVEGGALMTRLRELMSGPNTNVIHTLQNIADVKRVKELTILFLAKQRLLEEHEFQKDLFLFREAIRVGDARLMGVIWKLCYMNILLQDNMFWHRGSIWSYALKRAPNVATLDELNKLYPFNRNIYVSARPLHRNVRRYSDWINKHKNINRAFTSWSVAEAIISAAETHEEPDFIEGAHMLFNTRLPPSEDRRAFTDDEDNEEDDVGPAAAAAAAEPLEELDFGAEGVE